jgi:putative sigma-54 modulation protein
MDIIFTARRFDLNQTIKDHISRKLDKLEGLAGRALEARVTLTTENYRQIAEIRLSSRGQDFVATNEADDMLAAADVTVDRLERQLRRYKERRVRKRRDGRSQLQMPPDALPDTLPPLTRIDQVSTRPMSVDDAMEFLDEEGGEYLVFSNTETERLTVLYRRQDGSYGLIEPSA